MGVILRLVKWALRLGVAVLALTAGAVMYFSDANLRLYGGGRALEAPVDAILVLGGGIDGDWVLGYSSRRRVVVAVALLTARIVSDLSGSAWAGVGAALALLACSPHQIYGLQGSDTATRWALGTDAIAAA